MFLIDSHCHIDILNYIQLHKNLDDVLKKAKKNNICFFLTISTSLSNCKNILHKIKNYPNIKSSCGVHPLNNEKYLIEKLIKISQHKNIIAIGETGLDFSVLYDGKKIKKQKESFKKHIFTSISLNKPLIIHNRNADKDIIKIMQEEKKNLTGIMHCFNSSDINFLRKVLDINLYISFSGIITFKNANNIRNLIKFVPLDKLLIETDSPYLTPVPHRGKENQPSYLKYVAACIAEIKNMKIIEIAQITTRNFFNLFKIK